MLNSWDSDATVKHTGANWHGEIRRMVENHVKMSNLYAVDKYFTFPVNQRYFLFLVNQEDC